MPLAILGVTGYTGRLVLAEARRAGLEVRLVGRRREALEELAAPGEEVRVADARDESALRDAFDGATVVASCAGPFLELGLAPVQAAVAAGAHYLDTTGEQAFVRLVHERIEAGTVVLPAFGFDYVPGDFAARLAAEQVDGPLDEVVVALLGHRRRRRAAARGATIGRRDGPGAGRVGGRPARRRPASARRRASVRFPFGERTVVEWSGTEPLTVPRHTDVRNVRSYFRAPAPSRDRRPDRQARVAPLREPLPASARPVPRRRAGARAASPSSRRRRGPGGSGRAVVDGQRTSTA